MFLISFNRKTTNILSTSKILRALVKLIFSCTGGAYILKLSIMKNWMTHEKQKKDAKKVGLLELSQYLLVRQDTHIPEWLSNSIDNENFITPIHSCNGKLDIDRSHYSNPASWLIACRNIIRQTKNKSCDWGSQHWKHREHDIYIPELKQQTRSRCWQSFFIFSWMLLKLYCWIVT